MGDLQRVDGEDGDGRVDTEALETREESVGSHKESDDIREGGHAHRHPGVSHCPTKQLGQTHCLA